MRDREQHQLIDSGENILVIDADDQLDIAQLAADLLDCSKADLAGAQYLGGIVAAGIDEAQRCGLDIGGPRDPASNSAGRQGGNTA